MQVCFVCPGVEHFEQVGVSDVQNLFVCPYSWHLSQRLGLGTKSFTFTGEYPTLISSGSVVVEIVRVTIPVFLGCPCLKLTK